MRFEPQLFSRAFIVGLAWSWLLASSYGNAQVTKGNAGGGLPEALKDVRQASGVCSLDSQVASSGLSVGIAVVPDMQCATSTSEVMSLLGKPDSLVVDLRLPADYLAFHINGAMNLTAVDLHSKPYWRNKALILLGNGKGELELYRECRRLKQLGYKHVQVLQGGMLAWLTQGLPVSGRASSVTQMSRLSAADLWAEIQSTEVLILLDPHQAALQKDLPGSRLLAKTTDVALRAALERNKKQRKNIPVAAVILVADPAISDVEIQRLQQATAPTPLLIYSGTHDAFKRETAAQKAIWVAQARGPKQPGCGL